MRKILFLLLCLVCSVLARAQSSLTYRYWFDNADGVVQSVNSDSELRLDINVNGLSEGLHSLSTQVVSAEGVASAPATRYFIKSPLRDGKLRYWFDDDANTGGILNGFDVATEVDASMLDVGLHKLQVMIMTASPSNVYSCYFIKVPQVAGVNTLRCITFIDDMNYAQEDVAVSGGVVHYDLNALALNEGLHKISMLVMTADGAITQSVSSYFLRVSSLTEMSRMKCYYTIDGDDGYLQAGSFSDGTFHFDLDVDKCTDGLHQLTCLLVSESGTATSMYSAFFWKTPLGGNGIKSYEYWLNQDFEDCTKVNVDGLVSPLEMISLLPVKSMPLRSSQFHFEFKDGKPCLYAKNDFHIRFYDASGRFTDKCQPFIDYAVSQEITDADLLLSGSPVVKNKPAENEIQWYHFPAAVGDSLSFKVDRACTVQVFAPSGKEVYNASGSDVVRWDGCHAWEDGEYYLALHDVTAQQGTNTKLEYQHIDKYAVLEYTPDEVGAVEGFFSVSLFGNGYDKMEKAVLRMGDIEIVADTCAVFDISNAMLAFSIKDSTPLGAYDIELHFNDEGKEEILVLNKAIKIVEPVYGDVEIAISSQPRVAKPYPVTISIKNTGNTVHYMAPLIIAYTLSEGIHEANPMNFEILPKEIRIKTDSLFGMGVKAEVIPLIIPEIKPHEEIKFTFGFVTDAHHKFDFHAWGHRTEQNDSQKSSMRKKKEFDPCNPEFNRAWTLGEVVKYGQKHNADIQRVINGDYENYEDDCFPKPKPYHVDPYMPGDPNDMLGYITPGSESKYIAGDVTDVYYNIEFENDPEIANAAAHHIVICDTLNSKLHDLGSFAPTSVKFGNYQMMLDGKEQSFVKTLDMRPAVNALAQIKLDYDAEKGIAKWDIQSLDPMTLEPTDDAMMGILPVNDDNGSGQGEVTFDIKLKAGLADGTEIPNRASIVFDNEEAIMTPTWVNTIDAVAPTSRILDVNVVNDSTAIVDVEGFDERSGIWRYNLYVQQGEGSAWVLAAENVDTTAISVRVYDGISYGFCVLATDSAGNVEEKELHREYSIGTYLLGDANSDGVVDLQDAVLIVQYFVEAPDTYLNVLAADYNGDGNVDLQDAVAIVNKYVSSDTRNKPSRKRINKQILEQ